MIIYYVIKISGTLFDKGLTLVLIIILFIKFNYSYEKVFHFSINYP